MRHYVDNDTTMPRLPLVAATSPLTQGSRGTLRPHLVGGGEEPALSLLARQSTATCQRSGRTTTSRGLAWRNARNCDSGCTTATARPRPRNGCRRSHALSGGPPGTTGAKHEHHTRDRVPKRSGPPPNAKP